MKISVIGTGVYGLAIAMNLAKNNNNEILMWSENKELVEKFNKKHDLKDILDIKIPDNINITNSYEECLKGSKIIYITTVAKYVRSVCNEIKPYYNRNVPICIASKGIDETNIKLLSTVVNEILNTKKVASISGPTFAIDLAKGEPSALAVASKDNNTIRLIKNTLENDSLKLRETNDMTGIQICGAIKNVIAIASGILRGLGYTESTQAFLINESLHDIKYLIKQLGGKKNTILSFAGVGDLLLTCTSTKSRNYSFGYTIGSTKSKKEIDKYLKENTVEGYNTLLSMYKLINERKIDLPIINLIYDIVINGKDPESLATFLIEKK